MGQLAKRLHKWKTLGEKSSIVDVRRAFEEIDEILRRWPDVTESQSAFTPTLSVIGGTASIQNLPFPFVVEPSKQLFPGGVDLLFGAPCRITGVEIVSDPDIAGATADTTFTLQNALTAPTSVTAVTFATGSRRAYTASINMLLTTGQRLYIKAPAALNGIQNLYAIRLSVAPA